MPQTLRVAVASQQHYGVSMTRGINKPEVPPTPHDKLPADVQAEIAPYDAALAANPKDQAALVGEAAVFENHKLIANALEAYYKLRAEWPDAVWIKSKIFDLEQALADQAVGTAAAAAGGQTYALLVGISKYAKPELSLQFADAGRGRFRPTAGKPARRRLPPGNVLLLTDEKATTAAVRNGFQDFLKRRAGKNDTVVILIAGHGTVEVPGSKNAYILTYDSDPQDLNSTALADGRAAVAVRRSAQQSGPSAVVRGRLQSRNDRHHPQHHRQRRRPAAGDVEGDLFGLLASRPKEVSLEGPQFGGGHGVFSYYVIKGLEGAADENQDGNVDANELIQYVTDQVPHGDQQQTASARVRHLRQLSCSCRTCASRASLWRVGA